MPMLPLRYDLRSDTVTRPSPAMKRVMMDAPLGDDVLGDDPTVDRLEKEIAARAGKETGLFFPSGTQANQAAIQAQTNPGCEVLVESMAHVFNYEGGAPAALSGVQLHPIQTDDGVMRVSDLEARLRPLDVHFAQTRLVCLENTHNGHGGRVVPIDAMEEIYRWSRSHGLRVHLDGARLFNAVVASGISLERYAACADTVSICLSKGLGAPIGTCLTGDTPTIDRARWIRKRWGGGMRQSGLLAAAGLFALENNVQRLARDHELASTLARSIDALDGLRVTLNQVETNIILIQVDRSEWTATELVKSLAQEDVAILAVGSRTLRAVTHLDLPSDTAAELPCRFLSALARL